jgi:hypothetical protein
MSLALGVVVAQQCSLPVHPIKIFRGDTRQSFKGLNQACGVLKGCFTPPPWRLGPISGLFVYRLLHYHMSGVYFNGGRFHEGGLLLEILSSFGLKYRMKFNLRLQ